MRSDHETFEKNDRISCYDRNFILYFSSNLKFTYKAISKNKFINKLDFFY